MRLEHHYYELDSMHTGGRHGRFHIALRPDCEVYRGHFPGNPVCPGVCHIQTVKELTERLTGCRLRIRSIRLCRLKAVATPSACPELCVDISLSDTDGGLLVEARMADAERTYMDFKGEMTKEDTRTE